MSSPSIKSRQLQAFRRGLRKELATLFRVEPNHPGIERILEETDAHLEETIADLIDDGATIEAATTTALSRFGTASRVARAYGALKAPSFIDPNADIPAWRRLLSQLRLLRSFESRRRSMALNQWFSDVRLALRFLSKSPGYTLTFVLTLGLGIGANTAIFSVVHGVWLQPLPYRDGDRLVYLRHSADLAGIDNALFSVAEINDYRQQSPSLDGVTEFSAMTFTILGLDEPRRVRAGIVTGNYFEVMGLGARVGRVISSSDDGEAASAVAVLTYDYWQRQFGGDPDVIGRTVTMNDRSVAIIGVAEPAPPYPERTDIYVNMVASPHHLSASMVDDRVHRMTEVFARLAPDASLDSARAEVEAITRRLHLEHPEAYDPAHGYNVSLADLRNQLAADARPTMFMLLGVAAFVLVIACANVANLTLVRVMRRHNEWRFASRSVRRLSRSGASCSSRTSSHRSWAPCSVSFSRSQASTCSPPTSRVTPHVLPRSPSIRPSWEWRSGSLWQRRLSSLFCRDFPARFLRAGGGSPAHARAPVSRVVACSGCSWSCRSV